MARQDECIVRNAHLTGIDNPTYIREAYDPVKDHYRRYPPQKHERYATFYNGNLLRRDVARRGMLLQAYRVPCVLINTDGTCSIMDCTDMRAKYTYAIPEGDFSNIWTDCSTVAAPGLNSACEQYFLVAYTNGPAVQGGFCTWEMQDGVLSVMQVAEDFYTADWRQGSTVYWNSPNTYLMASAYGGCCDICLYDIRDGEKVGFYQSEKPIMFSTFHTPLQWKDELTLVIGESNRITVWDIGGTVPTNVINFPSTRDELKGVCITNKTGNTQTSTPMFDGIYYTKNTVYTIDFRVPSGCGTRLGVDSNINCVYTFEDSIYLGCNNVTNSTVEQSKQSMFQLSLTGGKTLTTYCIPNEDRNSYSSTVTQVWGDNRSVLALNECGLYVFNTFGTNKPPEQNNDNQCMKLRKVLGQFGMKKPSFSCMDNMVLITSYNIPPVWAHLCLDTAETV